MVFSIDTMKTPNNIFMTKENQGTQLESASYLFETLDFLLEENKTFNTSMIDSYSFEEGALLYKSLKYALSKIDPIKLIIDLVDKFVLLIQNLFDKFSSYLFTVINSDNYSNLRNTILENKKNLFIEKSYYMYTKLGVSSSLASFRTEFEKIYVSLDAKLSKFKNIKNKEEFHASLEEIKSSIIDTEYLDHLRGQICNRKYDVNEDDYIKELHSLFRVTEIDKDFITPNELKGIFNLYIDTEKNIKMCDKERADLRKYAKTVQQKISRMNLESYYTEEQLSVEEKNMFIAIIQNETMKVKNILNIYSLYFSSKLDAIKECCISYRIILNDAVKQIMEESND